MDINSGIYTITAPSGRCYIGSTIDFSIRKKRHECDLSKGIHHNSILQAAYNKYGKDGLIFKPILYCEPKDLLMYEQICIDGLNPEYNICKVAGHSMMGLKHSEETKQKISLANKGRIKSAETIEKLRLANIGKKNSLGCKRTSQTIKKIKEALSRPDVKEKILKANIGKKLSLESIERIRQTKLGKRANEETKIKMSKSQKGRKHSEETIEKMRKAKLGKRISEETKQKIGSSNTGRKLSKESIEKRTATRLKNKLAKLENQNV